MSETNEAAAVIVGGTVAIDHVKTPDSEGVDLLGGSASYAALAATFYAPDVRLVGIVGHDFPKRHLEMLAGRGVDLRGIEHSDGESFTWSGEYLENLNERVTHRVGLNVLENWEVKVPAEIADAGIVVLANMSPDNQLQMLEECGAGSAERGANRSGERGAGSAEQEDADASGKASESDQDSALRAPHSAFVIADTMDLWIEIANERLHEVLKRLDLFVINESEARDFTKTSNLVEAGRILLGKGPRFVVIKLGEFGAMLFSANGGSDTVPCPDSFFRCAAFPLRGIADPTGAGDSFLGGLAGYLASHAGGDYSFDNIRQAVAHGSVVASFTCEAFSTQRLEAITKEDVEARLEAFREMTKW